MSAHRRTARLLAAAALASTAAGIHLATFNLWLCVPGLYVAAFLAWCSNRSYAAHRRALAEAKWEQAYVLGQAPAPLNPCCALADHSGGAAHDRRKCTDLFHRLTADLAAEHPRSSQ
ncbi:hypothetical protein [Streptomyces sp. NPDC057253]|uniref:hypothetical protein n=1 Tax=Streptomyces sp. NPDC057253 TaxID=3346069 RepID=UPI00363FCC68